ncbi:hypothetical protein AAMO2058_000039500 [Amorphochlora amoebiformis]
MKLAAAAFVALIAVFAVFFTGPVDPILTSIDIASSPGRVWPVLSDFASWGEWNPIFDVEPSTPRPQVGTWLKITCTWTDGSVDGAEEEIEVYEEGRKMCWHVKLVKPHPWVVIPMPKWLLAADRCIEIAEVEPGITRVRNYYKPGAILGKMVILLKRGVLEPGFNAFNAALKAKIES